MPVGHRDEIMRNIAELVQHYQRCSAGGEGEILTRLTVGSLQHMPAARHAGITEATPDGKVRTVAATDSYPRMLDEIQQHYGEGPCITAAWRHRLVRVDDINHESRWADYCSAAAYETPIRSILAFQLFSVDGSTGALNFYAEHPHAFDDDAEEIGLVLATHTALVWNMVRRDDQFRSALASRDIIGQAKGLIMERFDIDAVQAFELLKRISQNSNTPVAEVAERLVNRRGGDR